jgi:hypothetical protein
MADLRSALEEAMEQAEDGTLEAPVEREIEVNDDPIRNEKGQFASKQEEESVAQAPVVEEETEAKPEQAAEVEYKPTVARPTTWKKEYLPLWDKLDKGENLSPEEARKMLEYSTQRETEYKKGVSAYKAEADNARALTEAISPFVPELQKNNIHPAAWINNLGRAHMILTQAPYQQKVELFNKLAQDYGIDLNSAYSGENTTQYQDPQAYALQQQIQQLQQQVQQVGSWKEQQEQGVLMNEIQRFSSDVEKHPHFEALREKMAQLLEKGEAQDLESAYEQARWQVPEVREQELKKLTQASQNQITNTQRIAKAKAAAVSPRSVTPNTQAGATDKKDRRSILAEQMGEIGSRV